VSSFKLNGATVQDGAGSNADLSGAINYNPAGILQIDTTPPAVTESLVSDTGVSATDKITSNDALTGSGDANAVVHFTVDSAAVSGTATADGTGKWNFTPTGLADGQHTVVASETDAAGNTGTASLTFTLDTTAPVVAITSTGGSVNQATQTVTGTVDVADAGTTVTVFDGTAQAGTATVQTNGSWSTSVTLAAGTNMLTAQDTDAAGNTGVSNAVTYTLNTTAPVVSSIVTSGTGITNGNGDLNAGKVVTLTVNFSAPVTVNTAGGSPTLALNDSGTAAYTGGSGTSALTFSYTVAAGQNTPDLVVSSFNLNNTTIQDGAGSNADLSGATNYNPAGILQIDTTVPTIAINNIAGNNTINASKASKGFAISGTTTDAENGQIVSVNIVNSQNTVVDSYTTADQNSAWSVNVTSTQALALIDGIYTVTADVPDQAGNLAPLATRSLTVEEDNKPEAPILTIASTALTVQAGGSISLGITATPIDSDDSLAVVIAGVLSYEAITAPSGDLVSKALQSSGTYTWTISETSSTTGKPLTGLTLASTYTGAGNHVAPLTVTASNTTRGETANSPSQTIAVTDPPAIASSQPLSTTPTNPTIAMPDFRSFGDAPPAGLAPSAYTTLAALLDQYMAARSCQDAPGVCQTSWTASQQAWLGDKEFLTRPQC
jgi:hypothetical protein